MREAARSLVGQCIAKFAPSTSYIHIHVKSVVQGHEPTEDNSDSESDSDNSVHEMDYKGNDSDSSLRVLDLTGKKPKSIAGMKSVHGRRLFKVICCFIPRLLSVFSNSGMGLGPMEGPRSKERQLGTREGLEEFQASHQTVRRGEWTCQLC